MKVAILHLSDMHFRSRESVIFSRVQSICATLNNLPRETLAIIVVVTGDIVFSGKKEEFDVATEFFNTLLSCIKSNAPENADVYFITAPGNHDGAFKQSTGARDAVIDSIASPEKIDASIIDICTEPLTGYFSFVDQFDHRYIKFQDKLFCRHDVPVGSKVVSFCSINASWMSQVPERQGHLVFPTGNYLIQMPRQADVKIAMMHHPLNWYAQSSYHPLREMCRNDFQIVLSGHEHKSSETLLVDKEYGASIHLEAGALDPHDGNGESYFRVINLDLEQQRYAVMDFSWDGSRYIPQGGNGVWDSYAPLPEKEIAGFSISEATKRMLDDVGANFTHPHKEIIQLSDIFVYPDMRLVGDGNQDEIISTELLLREIPNSGKVILRGEEQLGKTSLLCSLYQRFFQAGLVPVLISGRDLIGYTADQCNSKINDAVEYQYGSGAGVLFQQLERSKRVILVDDIDRYGLHGDAIARALEYVNDNFNSAIITASDSFDLAELSSSRATQISAQYGNYKILGFGFRLRAHLIKRWLTLGAVLTKDELQEATHLATSTINSVIGKGVVPPTAFNILILLMSTEVGKKGVLVNSGMAQYYEYLIRRSFLRTGLRADSFDEVFNYLAALSWRFYVDDTKAIDAIALEKFTSDYSNEIYATNFNERVDLLVKARVLSRIGNSYAFRYPYYKYFFAAMYAAGSLNDNQEIQEKIQLACKRLYVRENANIILFLTHHTSTSWVIKEISAVAGQLLSSVNKFDVNTDTKILNQYVDTTARILVDATDVQKNRDEHNKAADSVEALSEPETNSEVESISDLDVISQLNLLIKTCEILGQILKNRYGSLNNSLKRELMTCLFDAPLRGMNLFLSIINSSPEALVGYLSERFTEKSPGLDKEKADQLAKRMIFSSVGAFSDALLARHGEIIGSQKLTKTISEVTESQKGATYSLISVAAQLSFPGGVPHSQIQALSKQLQDNVFGFNLLQGLVARHMYMFSLPYAERQMLAEAVKIDLRAHLAKDVGNAHSKRLVPAGSPHKPKQSGLLAKLSNAYFVKNASQIDKVLKAPKKTDKA